MKIIPLSEAKAYLRRYGRQCHKEPIIVTVNGHPSFQLMPLDEGEDLMNQLVEHNREFQAMLKAGLDEPTLSVRQAMKKLRD
jgi:PHD/YefM family antitoxin component YafN of YafNO toxin-antitoxin module